MDKLLSDESISWMIIAGSYMNEVKENFNQILASNSRPMKFFGYNVVTLNLEFQGMTKNVARQMITNQNNYYKRKNMKERVDFAVMYSYHPQSREYIIQLLDDHKQTRLNMREIAMKIATKSKYGNGRAGGFNHIGSFHLSDTPNFMQEAQTMSLK